MVPLKDSSPRLTSRGEQCNRYGQRVSLHVRFARRLTVLSGLSDMGLIPPICKTRIRTCCATIVSTKDYSGVLFHSIPFPNHGTPYCKFPLQGRAFSAVARTVFRSSSGPRPNTSRRMVQPKNSRVGRSSLTERLAKKRLDLP